MNWIIDGLAAFLVSVTLTGIIIPQILLIAFRKKLFDEPDERKIHKAAVPRLGGMAFMPSVVFSLCLVIGVEVLCGTPLPLKMTVIDPENGVEVASALLPLCFGLCSLMLMYLVGLADDLIGVKYRAKFVVQIIAAFLLAAAGARLDNLHGMLGIYELPWPLAWAFTMVLVVFIINAINLIDGIDGLASGLSGIAMAFYGMTFLAADRYLYALVAFAGLGTLVPFFYYNVFGDPAKRKKIFMGDTGSLTIGIILAFLSLETAQLPTEGIFSSEILIVAFAPLAIPCLDVVRVFVHRIIRGHSPFLPDRVHIHHKLLAMGVPTRLAMISILAVSAAVIAINMWLSHFCSIFVVLMIDLVTWVLFNWRLSKAIHSRQNRLGITGGYE